MKTENAHRRLSRLGSHLRTFPFGAVAACAVLMAVAACSDGRLTGGYDDVENPAIAITLQDPQGHPAAGEVKVYARFQNPSLDSIPVLTRSAPAGSVLQLSDTALVDAMRLAQARGIPWPATDTLEFNIVTSAPAAEAYAGNFILARSLGTAYQFQQRLDAVSVRNADSKGVLPVSLSMGPPVLALHGSIGSRGLPLGLKSLFIPGSPYWSPISSDGSFTLARLASGKYAVKAVSNDGKVYSAADTLNTADSAYSASDWSEADLIWIQQ